MFGILLGPCFGYLFTLWELVLLEKFNVNLFCTREILKQILHHLSFSGDDGDTILLFSQI